MGNNRLPVLSRISPEVRDNDFIPITELKVFDARIDEIVKLFNSIEASGESGNIAQQMKDIEYNMADALIFDTDGNIVGYKTDENNEPIYGENDIKTMLSKLEDYYNQFVMLMGNDPRMDNWKADLNRYYTEAIGELNNKINSIFRNSINMTALEAKEDPKNNYVLDEAKEMTSGSIMRLNPDTSTYIRNINVRISNPGEENVVFDVIEAVKDSLVMNLKLQNGSMYFDFNIVIDKGKIFISNERVLPEEAIQLTNGYIIKIYKFYEEFSDKAHYVFTFSAPVTDIYGFEITGILVSGFDFNNSGLGVTSHSKYYKYVLVENEEPNYNETYYFKETDPSIEDGKISYVPVEKVTSFDPEKEYYRKERQFFKFKEWDVFNYEYDGNITTDGYLKDNEDQVVVEKAKYNKDLKMINVNIENEEIVNKDLIDYKNHIIKNEEMWNPDDSVRIVHRGTGSNRFDLLGKGAYKPTNKDIMAFGEVIFEKYDLSPGEIVALNDCIAEGYDRQVTHGTSDRVTISEKTYLKTDFTNTENPVKFVSKVIFKSEDISGIINKYIMDNIAFVGKIKIMMYIGKNNPEMIYFYLLPDDCEYDVTSTEGISDVVFYSFALNLSDKKQSVFTFVRPEIKNDVLKKLGELWNDSNDTSGGYYCITLANDGTLVAGGYNSIKYSDDNGKTWNDTNETSGTYNCITVAKDGRLIAGCSVNNRNDIKYSDDNGITWNDSDIFSGQYKCITLAKDGTLVAGSINDVGIKYSDDNGITWKNSNLTSGSYNCITLAKDGTLIAGSYQKGIKYSDDNGITWKNSNLTSGSYNCITLANNGRLIAGSSNGNGIKYSDDNGITWNNSNITINSYYCITVAKDGTLVAGSYNNKGIIYSDDNGITWNDSNITSGSYHCIVLANDGTLIAGSYNNNGIKYSDDNGITWNDTNITSGVYKCITVANDDTLVASDFGNGIKYSDAIYSHKPITKLYSLPNESVVRDVNEKFGHNGYTFAEIPNERLIYSTLDKTFIKNPADDDYLFDYQFNKAQNNKVIGTNPINSKIDPATGDIIYKNTTFDKRYNVEDINEGSNTDIIKSFVTDSIYINKNNTLSYFDDWSSNIENLPDIDHIDLDYGFETDDGVFVVGKVGTKDIVCFAPWPTNNKVLNFSVGFTADYIDYLRPYNNEIIISSYDAEHDGARWKFNRDTLAFEGDELVNGNSIPSFNNVFEIHGSLYIINGTGKRTVNDSYQGLYKLYKSTANNVNNGYFIHDLIEEFSLTRVGEKEFYNIPMIKFYENNSEYYLFIYNNIVNKEIRIDFDLYEYADGELSRVNSTTITDSTSLANGYSYTAIIFNSPICKKINSILKTEFNKISESIDYEYVNPDYSIVTQTLNDSFDNMVINSNNDIVNNPNLLHEKFYFDKENSYVKFETTGVNQEDRRFVLSSEKIAVGTTLMSNKTNIVINLAKDCKVAVFDKACECLKTVSLGYEVNLNGQKTVVKFDPEYFMFDNLIIGSENEKNTIYIVVHGRFPTVTLNNNEFVFDYDVDSVYKLFSIDIDNIVGSNNELLVATLENNYTFEGTIPTSGSIRNYIKTRKLQMVSRQLELELVDDLQYVDVVNELRYENTSSIVFWNTVSNSLDFVTKINIRDKYKTVIENNSETVEPVDLILCEGNNFKIEEFKPSKENTYGKIWKPSEYSLTTVRCLTLANNGRLLAGGGNGGGIEYSDDNGLTWNGTNFHIGVVSCIALANDGRLIANVYDLNNNNTRIDRFIYSDDNGETWIDSNKTDYQCNFITLANNGRLIAGYGNYYESGDTKGIIYSDDNGETWNDSNITSGNYSCITVANNNRLVAGSYSGKGIKYSDDNGETWIDSNITSGSYNCIILANDGRLVAGSEYYGIKYSDDNGITWNNSNISYESYWCVTLVNNGRLVAGGYQTGIKYSDDNGLTWNDTNITSGYYAYIILANDGKLVACDDNKKYGGTDIGIKYSDDNGETWIDSNIINTTCHCIILANDGTLVASVRNSYIIYSLYSPIVKLNEVNDNQLPIPYGKKSVEFIDKSDKDKLRKTCYVKDGLIVDEKFVSEKKEFNDNVIIIKKYNRLITGITGKIKYSDDNGETWNDSNITSDNIYIVYIALANGGRLIASSNNGIKYSDDNGITWNDTNITKGEYRKIIIANNGILVAISGYFAMHTDTYGIKYSDDNGKTWKDSNIANYWYRCIVVANNDRLIVGSGGRFSSGDGSNGIKYSDDNGITWNDTNITDGIYYCITITNNGRLVAGSEYYGIKYSDDNGETWIDSNITSGSYNYIILANDGRLVASCSNNDNGILYSDDNGITWNDTNIAQGGYNCITVANNDRLVAGSYSKGIIYSDDNGKTWKKTNITSGAYYCITVANDGRLIASSGSNKGIKYSDDNGETWNDTNITNGSSYCIRMIIKQTKQKPLITETSIGTIKCDNILKLDSQNKLVIDIDDKPIKFIKDTSEGVLFVVKDSSEDLVYKLKNIPNEKEISINDENYFELIGRRKEIVDVENINNDLIILNKTTFSGKTWNDTNITSNTYYCITKANNGRLVASGNNGIKYSDDNGKTWNDTNITGSSYYCITLANDGTLVAGGYNSIKYSDDNGKTWNDTNITSGSYKCMIVANNGWLVACDSGSNKGIKYSDDNGKTWKDSDITSGYYSCITLANDGRLIAGGDNYGSSSNNNIKYSDDNGKTWTNTNTSGYYNCITKANDGRLIVGGNYRNGIKYSDDNGKTWNDSNINGGEYKCITLAKDGTLVAGSYGDKGIKYSDDNGKTWNDSNITSGIYLCITVTNDGRLIAGNYNKGIKYSDDNGITWNDTNITSGGIFCITLANNGRLVAGSYSGHGIKYGDEIINDKLIFIKSNDSDYKIILKNGNVYNKDNTLLIVGKYNLKNINSNIINPNIYSKSLKHNILIGENNILIDFDKNIHLPKSAKVISNSVLHTIQINHNHDSSSFDKIAKILFEKGIPLDKTVKVIGSIIYNNIPVSITNLRIVSDNSKTNTPLAIYFSIDKEFRLPNDVFINNGDNFTGNNANGEYDQFVKRGIISNYNIDTNEKITDINNVITKCNFTVICDNQ